MRSELPWLEPRSPWQRFGPTLLGLSIIGVGMGGAIRIVKAQDKAAPPPAGATSAVTVVAQSNADADPVARQEDRATSRELDSLLQQRAQLDARIADLRQRLRSADQPRPRVRVETRSIAPRVQVDPASPEWQRAIDDARQQARDAMQQAREAMRQAQEAMREAQRAGVRIDGGKGAYTIPPLPNSPTLPRFNFNFNKDSTSRAYTVDPEALKRLQDALRSMNGQEQWMQKWKEMQPQLEQQMREFQQRMQEWQRSFEVQQRAMEKQLQQQYRNSDLRRDRNLQNLKEPDEPKSSTSDRNKATDNGDNEPL